MSGYLIRPGGAVKILNDLHPCIIQPRIDVRTLARGRKDCPDDFCRRKGLEASNFTVAGGQLTDRISTATSGRPRAPPAAVVLQPEQLTPARLEKSRRSNGQAEARGQKLS